MHRRQMRNGDSWGMQYALAKGVIKGKVTYYLVS